MNWLPELTPFIGYNNWNEYVDFLYDIFKRDFIDDRPLYLGKPVFFDKKQRDGKPEGFWHLLTDGSYDYCTGQRDTSLLRCERVGWIRPIIENNQDAEILFWRGPGKRNKEIRHYLFLHNYDYVVILIERKGIILATAFYVNYGHTKRKLLKAYNKYKSKTAPATGTV